MTWKTFQQEAFEITAQEVNPLRLEVIYNYNQAKKSIEAEIDALYKKYLSGIKPDDYYNTVIKADRLKNLERTIAFEYSRYTNKAGKYIQAASRLSMSNVYYRKMFASGWLVPEVATGILPPALIELSVYGTAEKWKAISKSINKVYGDNILYQPQSGTIMELLSNNRRKELRNINRAITQGLQLGKSNTAMVDSVADIIGKRVVQDGVTGFTGAQANAMRIIRTETTRTMNAGGYAQAKYLQSVGVEIMRLWDSALDSRTRSSHAALDGQMHTPDEPFYIGSDSSFYPGNFALTKNNVNCRCSVAETVNGNDPQLRRGRDPESGRNEVFSYKNFEGWAKEKGLKKNIYGELYFPEKK